jgi:uncharacterized protein (TIGR02448 family)
MIRLPVLASLVCALACSPAFASSFIATTDTLGVSLANSAELSSDASSSLRDDKRVRAARDEAASFVASAGELRGARLEAALRLLRGTLAGDEMQLAQAILAR